MIIKYKNFTITDDRNCFRLAETKIVKGDNEGDNEGEEYDANIIYPSTLYNALKAINDRLRISDNETYTLKEGLDRLEVMNNKFIEDIKLLIN